MPDPNDPIPSVADPLDVLIADYLQQVDTGAVPDREALLVRHPNRTTDADAPAGELPRVRYFGDYELQEVIARGGMGVVYKARQVTLNRVVALKMILRGELATAHDLA